jgi:hypothetical protein
MKIKGCWPVKQIFCTAYRNSCSNTDMTKTQGKNSNIYCKKGIMNLLFRIVKKYLHFRRFLKQNKVFGLLQEQNSQIQERRKNVRGEFHPFLRSAQHMRG